MKILFITNLYPPNAIGGYERLCHAVASALALGNTVTVITSTYGKSVSIQTKQSVQQVLQLLVGKTIYEGFEGSEERRNLINRSNAYFVDEVINRVNPDVIYCWSLHGLNASIFEPIMASNRPTVLMLTDNWFVPMWRHLSEAMRASERLSAIFGSQYMRQYYLESGVRFRRDEVIHNGVSLSDSPDERFRDRHFLVAGGEFRILFAGRIVPVKGVHTAVEALIQLTNTPSTHELKYSLSLIGDQSDKGYLDSLREMARSGGCGDALQLMESVPPDELFEMFQSYDCLVFPSTYEPFALTLILALDAGIPTIATAVGGNVEIVSDQESGLLMPVEDASCLAQQIERLSVDAELRCSLSRGGRKAASEFSFNRMIAQTELTLERLVNDAFN
ncbi:MAG: glycosyltransferase family 4 protein [Proteobacteria bacterium]|nr:glycosyltransferase family 4 protein [Pseudomonadota bacterium]